MNEDMPDVDIEGIKARINSVAEESLREIFHRMPFGQKVELSNGKTATITKFFEPKQNEGVWQFGVDMKFDDGSGHVEFIIKQTGWEGAP